MDNGNAGSVSDFLESLKGPKGDKGEDGVGSSKLKDATVTDGALVITKEDGTEVKVQAQKCPGILLTDAFGKIEVGYVFAETCEKENDKPSDKPVEKDRITAYVRSSSASSDFSLGNTFGGFDPFGNASNVVFLLDKPTDAPVTFRFVVHAKTDNGVELFNDVYQATVPAGETYVAIPSKLYTMSYLYEKDGAVGSVNYDAYKMEIVEYNGNAIISTDAIAPPVMPLDHL